jgi:hypothetical protein
MCIRNGVELETDVIAELQTWARRFKVDFPF